MRVQFCVPYKGCGFLFLKLKKSAFNFVACGFVGFWFVFVKFPVPNKIKKKLKSKFE